MNELDVIFTRRSTRNFIDKEIEKSKIEKIVLSGQHAPTARNQQKCHFIVIQNKNVIKEIGDLVRNEFRSIKKSGNYPESLLPYLEVAENDDYMCHYNPNVFIIVAVDKDYENGMADSACALENMMICANALDLGSCWINQLRKLMISEKVKNYLFNLGMLENETVYGCLSVGYPEGELKRNLKHQITSEVNYIW